MLPTNPQLQSSNTFSVTNNLGKPRQPIIYVVNASIQLSNNELPVNPSNFQWTLATPPLDWDYLSNAASLMISNA